MVEAQWISEKLYFSGDDYFDDLIGAIESARYSVDLETYIFEKGFLAERLVDALIRAARRGVRVRVVVDGWGSPNFLSDYWPILRAAKIKVRFFRVIPWILRRLPGDPKSLWQRFWQRWRQINRGTHRKFCLVDYQALFVGSYNISDVHLKSLSGPEAWQDVGVQVQGPETEYAKRAFERVFSGWRTLRWPMQRPRLLLLNDSYGHKQRARREILQHLRRARQRVWLATPYFVPIGAVFRSLVRGAQRGVDVRLLVPHKSDVPPVKIMSIPLLRALTEKGVHVNVFQPAFAHQKIFIADDWMCVGSTNLNHRSFLHDLELDVVITHASNKKALEAHYLRDLKCSEPFDRFDWVHLPIWQRLLASIFSLLKYWA